MPPRDPLKTLGEAFGPHDAPKSSFFGGLGKALPVIGVALDAFGYIRAKRLRERAEVQAHDSRAIATTLSPSDSGRNLGVAIGRVRLEGLLAYAGTGANVPWRPAASDPSTRTNADGIGGLDYWRSTGDGGSGGVKEVAPARGNARNEFLLIQEYLLRHDIEAILGFGLDGQNGWLLPAIGLLGEKGVASDLATRFAQGHGSNVGNGDVERGPTDTFPLGSHVDLLAWNDTSNPNRHFTRVPTPDWLVKAARLPVVDGTTTLSLGTPTYSTSAPRALLWLFTEPWGFDVSTPSQTTLASIKRAQARSDAVMQGRKGLWADTYPSTFNDVDGTQFATYAEAFRARGYTSYSALTQARSEITDSADPGSETGWPQPLPGPNTSYSLIQDDWQTLTVKRCECNGVMHPSVNLREMLNSVMQTMPFSSFARSLTDGERVLSIPDLDGAADSEDMTVTEDSIRAFSLTPATDPYEAVEVHFSDMAANGADATVRYPVSKRAGADTPAAAHVKARHGDRANVLVINAQFIGDHFHAFALARSLFEVGKADIVRLTKHGRNEYAEVNDKVRVLYPSRGIDIRFLPISVSTSLEDGAQELVGYRIGPHMSNWPVYDKPGSVITEAPTPAPLTIGPICATADDGVVTLDFDCTVDDDGNITPAAPRFEDGCDAERRVENGSDVEVALPVMGPGDASYTVTGTNANIVYNADTHSLEVDAATPANTYPITVNGTVGDTAASCTLNLVVVQGSVDFVATLEGELGTGPLVYQSGDEWRVFLDRLDGPQFGVRVRVSGTKETTGKAVWSAAPSGVTFTGVADQTLTADSGDLVGTYVRYHFGDNDFDGVLSCVVTVGGQSHTLRLIVSRNAPS